MSNDLNTYQHPLLHSGTSQQSRLLPARDPNSLQLMDLTAEDWLQLASDLGTYLRWHNPDNPNDKGRDWSSFWPEISQQANLWESLSDRADIPAHLALYLSFLQLLEESKGRFNQLTVEHLDFYYQNILQTQKKNAVGDTIHVHFELAKRVAEQRLAPGTLLNAKKDGLGQARYYQLMDETIINRAQIAHLRQETYLDNQGLFYAPVANSADGLGSPFPEENAHWPALGGDHLPLARIGWALASKELWLQEGERTIILDLALNNQIPNLGQRLSSNFLVYLTGAEEWIGPFKFSSSPPSDWDQDKRPVPQGHTRVFLSLPSDVAAVVPYNSEVHQEAYSTNLPLMRMVLDDSQTEVFDFYRSLSRAGLNSLTLSTWVRGVQNLTVENDLGILDPSKPFLPFGSLPRRDSIFYIGNPEVFSKAWQEIKLNLNWKGLPTNLKQHYDAYGKGYINERGEIRGGVAATLYGSNDALEDQPDRTPYVSGNTYFEVAPEVRKGGRWLTGGDVQSLFAENGSSAKELHVLAKADTQSSTADQSKQRLKEDLRTANQRDLKATAVLQRALNKQPIQAAVRPVLMERVDYKQKLLATANWNSFPKQGFIRFKLRQTFFHLAYPELLALSKIVNPSRPVVPNTAYTPTLSSIGLEYFSSSQQQFHNAGADESTLALDFQQSKIQLFHDFPFGQSRQHTFVKWQQRLWAPETSLEVRCVPAYRAEGRLLIGLQDIEPNQQVNLLLQFAEGSENPLREPLTEETGVQWSVLCANVWKPLVGTDKLLDTTEHWLRSGIVRLRIPSEATTENSILEDGYIWLKASLPTPLDRVCHLLSVHAQGARATLIVPEDLTEKSTEEQELILDHLSAGLPPETVKALQERIAGIQKVHQPYASFDGRPVESDSAYYRRLSERLRHKDRAVNIWDYEHLVLEHFPELHKVKCITHTDIENQNFLANGDVSLVIIPRINPENAHDRLRPRAGRRLRNAVDEFLHKRVSPHVSVRSVNALFEPVKITAEVAFVSTVDANFYLGELQEALRIWLSPWAAEGDAEISFGATIYRSGLVRFLENLPYVDYISGLNLRHDSAEGELLQSGALRSVTASTVASVLVSAPQHDLSIVQASCP